MSTFNIPNHERDFQSMMIPKGKRQSDMSQVTRSPHRSINTTDGQQKKKKSGSDQERSKRPTDDVVNSFDQSGMHESSAGEHFSQMMNEKYSINIGSKKIQFDIRDPIFQLAKANPQTIPSNACFSCEKDLSTKKQHDFCQFCGNRACQICMHKERAFPGVKAKITQKKPKGKICKVCDRKFILYNTYSEYAQQIEQQDQLISFNYNLLVEKDQQLHHARQEFPEVKKQVKEAEKQLSKITIEQSERVDQIEREQEEYSQKIETMKYAYGNKEFDLKDKKDTINFMEEEFKSIELNLSRETSTLQKKSKELNIVKKRFKTIVSKQEAKKKKRNDQLQVNHQLQRFTTTNFTHGQGLSYVKRKTGKNSTSNMKDLQVPNISNEAVGGQDGYSVDDNFNGLQQKQKQYQSRQTLSTNNHYLHSPNSNNGGQQRKKRKIKTMKNDIEQKGCCSNGSCYVF